MLTITVDPASSLIDDKPTTFSVSGLEKGQQFCLHLESTDAHGVTWTCSDTFQADDQGVVDVLAAHLKARYDPMHLFNALQPTVDPPAGALVYAWSPDPSSWSDPAQLDFTLSVRDVADTQGNGAALASATIARGAGSPAEPVLEQPGELYPYGVWGLFFPPPEGATRNAAMLIFGGSEGNIGAPIQVAAGLLAARGYPTLALGYFTQPPTQSPWHTFPTHLSRIPLEYFKGALDYLSSRTDAATIFVSGTSRGSEAALLLAANYGRVLGDPPAGPYASLGVIANVPSNNVMCGITATGEGDPHRSGWTVGGHDIPFDDPNKPHRQAAEIPVEQINGPIFLDGAGSDRVWESAKYVEYIVQRLKSHGIPEDRYEVHEYSRGGHGLGILVAYLPLALSTRQMTLFARVRHTVGGILSSLASLRDLLGGKDPDENHIIDGDLWPRLLKFLETHS